jgi:cytochrome P450
VALRHHPAQASRVSVSAGGSGFLEGAIEELLRYDSPVQRNRRLAMEDMTFGGKHLARGDSVLVFMGSANRDPAKFADPDALDITRSPNPHMAFGHGIHFCAGAALTRLEAPIALRALLDRFPTVRLAEDFTERWHRNITFRGLESLDLRID